VVRACAGLSDAVWTRRVSFSDLACTWDVPALDLDLSVVSAYREYGWAQAVNEDLGEDCENRVPAWRVAPPEAGLPRQRPCAGRAVERPGWCLAGCAGCCGLPDKPVRPSIAQDPGGGSCGLAVRVLTCLPRRGVPCEVPGFSGKGIPLYLPFTDSYLATMSAGTRPRSLTLRPCVLAQARISLFRASSEAVAGDLDGLRAVPVTWRPLTM
jgi:hypothetical protein